MIFRVEDEMYKTDFDNANIYRTMKVLEEEKIKIDQMNDQEKVVYRLDPKKFSQIRLKQIEKIYGDLG